MYGKAYVEFFCSPSDWEALRPKLDAAPSVSYLATTAAGEPAGNMGAADVNALTWGVFPGGSMGGSRAPVPHGPGYACGLPTFQA